MAAKKVSKAKVTKTSGMRKVLYFGAARADLMRKVDAACRAQKISFAALACKALAKLV
jgi:uncharacterized HAD superfamily protein